jgi:adenine-specific DNA-methyltransferase
VFQIDPLFNETGEKKFKPKSIWFGTNYSTDGATKELRKILPDTEFTNPKPVQMITDIVLYSTSCNDVILDFFAGSGTTAHALINCNRDENSRRKYILVEMANYFDTVMKPRIEKIMYTNDWKDGKPQNTDGINHMFKYIYLEQYEDTLNNIEFKISETVQKTLKNLDGYFINYMLDFETRESSVRLNVNKFDRSFDYKLKINNENGAGTEESIDLIETFNYLLGLHIKQIKFFNNKDHYYRVVFGVIENKTIVIIWRNTDKLDLKEDKKFIENIILKNSAVSTIYINGDSYLKNAITIEPIFKKLMGG